MRKIYWRGVWSGMLSLSLAVLFVLSIVEQMWAVAAFTATMLIVSVVAMLFWKEVAKEADVERAMSPNVYGIIELGRIVWGKFAVVVDQETGEAAVFVGGQSHEQVEKGLFEAGWVHTSKGWTK